MINIRRSLKILKIIWYFFKPYQGRTILMCLSMFLAGLFEAINLALLYPVMSYGLKQEARGTIPKLCNKLIYFFGGSNLFVSTCVLLIVVTAVAVFFRFLNYQLQYKLMARMDTAIQNKVLEKYLNADFIFFVKNQQGKLIHTGTIASNSVSNMIIYAAKAINDSVSFIFLFTLLVVLSWQATIVVAIIGLFYLFFVRRVMTRIIYRCGLLSVEANREKNIILNELINGIKAIKIFLNQKSWEKKYQDNVKKSVYNQFEMLMGRTFPELFMKFMYFFLLALAGIFINWQTKENIVSLIPLYGTFGMVANRLFPLTQTLGGSLMILAESLPNTKIVYDLLTENTQKIRDGTKIFPGFRKDIVFKDVWFKYEGTDKYLLKNISFTIEKHKVTAIVGLSGSGKTTLINLLLRLYGLGEGQIVVDGVDISEYTIESFLRKIGYVGQETFIYNDSVRENIRFAMENCSDEMIVEAARKANAYEFILNMANTYDSIVGDAGIKLSGGQRQRIALARAVLRNPEIMILDEATSSLDNISERKVQEAIYNVSQNTTVIIVTHRLSTIVDADRILLLHGGQIVEQGLHQELLAHKGLYFRLYTRQLREKGKSYGSG